MKNAAKLWCSKALDLVLPPRCVVSGVEVDHQGMISPDIWARLNFIATPYCQRCSLPFEYEAGKDVLCASCMENPPQYDALRAALVYDDTSRDMVLKFKHADQMHNVKAFIPWLRMAGGEMIENADYILPVPLHRWRLMKRRYNQAAVMALALSRDTGKSCIPDGVLRVRSTSSQGHLKAAQRAENVKKAFIVNPAYESLLEGKNIILVDDVYTTGSTVNECAKTLRQSGAKTINVLTLTRAVK